MAVKKQKSAGSRRIVTVDMTGVEASTLVPEDDYVIAVKDVTVETAKESNKRYLKWKFQVAEGKYAGQALYHNTSLQPQALFNLKGLLIALEVPVPQSALRLNLDEMIGLTCGATVGHERFEGKDRARITDFFPLDVDDEGDDSDEDLTDEEVDDEVEDDGDEEYEDDDEDEEL